PIRRKSAELVRRRPMMEYVGHGPVDLRIAAAALLVVKTTRVADTGQYQTMLDACGFLSVAGKPGDCPDGCWDEQKPVRVPSLSLPHGVGEKRRHRHAGQIVITERRVTDMRGDQDFVR